jgi:hypothetical protein
LSESGFAGLKIKAVFGDKLIIAQFQAQTSMRDKIYNNAAKSIAVLLKQG